MIIHDKNLTDLNTFKVPAKALYFAVAENDDSLKNILETIEWKESKKHLILGGGSNILFVNDYDGFVLKNEIKGIEVVEENDNEIFVKVGAGENWHDFVIWSVERGLWGIENLVYIPGTVGAAPVQNIGAYGVEVASVIDKVEYFDVEQNKIMKKQKEDCKFDYRQSIFKKNPGKYIITHVYFKLKKDGDPILDYGRVKDVLKEKNILNPSSVDIAKVIMEIRKLKLPEVGEIGTAGSFFKNPIISHESFITLKEEFPEIKYFELDNGDIKIPAGWILDELGYKGFMDDHVGNYKNHALIIVHDGEGTGQEVYNHVQNIFKKVREVFGIKLEPEVNIIK